MDETSGTANIMNDGMNAIRKPRLFRRSVVVTQPTFAQYGRYTTIKITDKSGAATSQGPNIEHIPLSKKRTPKLGFHSSASLVHNEVTRALKAAGNGSPQVTPGTVGVEVKFQVKDKYSKGRSADPEGQQVLKVTEVRRIRPT